MTPDPWKAVALSSLARPAKTVDLPYGGKGEEFVRTKTINTYIWLDSERIKFCRLFHVGVEKKKEIEKFRFLCKFFSASLLVLSLIHI